MARSISFIVTNSGTINAVAGGKAYVVPSDHNKYNEIKKAVIDDDAAALENLTNLPKKINAFASGKVEVRDGEVFYMGEAVHNAVSSRIVSLMEQGFPFEPMLKFLEKLMENPSRRSVQELYNFLEHRALPITEDGDFLAYKRIRSDWTDKHSGKFSNTIGAVLEMPRNKVDDDFRHGCSYGFHAGSIEYVVGGHLSESTDDHIVIVKINPKDVVSVPEELNCTKLRTARYEVVREYEGDLTAALYKPNARVSEQRDTVEGNGGYGYASSTSTATLNRDEDDFDDEDDDEDDFDDEDDDEDDFDDEDDDEDIPAPQGW
jgi:hypothetical protein